VFKINFLKERIKERETEIKRDRERQGERERYNFSRVSMLEAVRHEKA
jgi:hypothetical protein